MFANRFHLLSDGIWDVADALVLAEGKKRLFWDALLASTMKRNFVTTIITENTKDFKELEVKVVNPLA